MFREITVRGPYGPLSELDVVPGRVNLLVGASGTGKTASLGIIKGISDYAGQGELLSAAFPSPSGVAKDTCRPSRTGISVAFVLEEETFDYTVQFQQKTVLFHGLPRAVNCLVGEELVCRPWKGNVKGRVLYDVKETEQGRTTRTMVNGRRHRTFLPYDFEYKEDRCSFTQLDNPRTCPELDRAHRFFWKDVRAECPEHVTASYARALAKQIVEPLGTPPEPEVLKKLLARLPIEVTEAYEDHVRGVGAEAFPAFGPFTAGGISSGEHELDYLCSLLPGGSRGGWKVLLLDNPATNMSPSDIHCWLTELVDSISGSDRQVFVVTHNPEIINYLAASDSEGKVFLFRKAESGQVEVGEAVFDRECGLSAAEQLARGQVDIKDVRVKRTEKA